MLVYLNGHFLSPEDARVSVFDHGFLYGDGIYETLRAYRGAVYLLDQHLERLRRSADAISLTLPLPTDEIAAAIHESLAVNKLQDAYIRIQLSRGPGEIGLDPALCPTPTVVIAVKPFHDYPREQYEQGVAVAIVRTRRNHPLALDPAVKSTNFLNNILAKIESLRAGAYEGIMLNWKGYVAEGTISNIFTVHKAILYTPHRSTGILGGVTRALVLRIARQAGIRTREVLLRPRDLDDADECFITNTTVEVLPVTSVDGRTVGGGAPGPVTRTLMQAYRDEVLRHV
jgi:branched-chain amino acid aminotransferase